MWNWNIGKTIILGLVVGIILGIAGLSLKAIIIVTIGLTAFISWLIREINFIRNSHGSNIEELKNEVEELKERIDKIEKKKA